MPVAVGGERTQQPIPQHGVILTGSDHPGGPGDGVVWRHPGPHHGLAMTSTIDGQPGTPSPRPTRRTVLRGLAFGGATVAVAGTGLLSYRVYDSAVLDPGGGPAHDPWRGWRDVPGPSRRPW